jgi:hypothetical protein
MTFDVAERGYGLRGVITIRSFHPTEPPQYRPWIVRYLWP